MRLLGIMVLILAGATAARGQYLLNPLHMHALWSETDELPAIATSLDGALFVCKNTYYPETFCKLPMAVVLILSHHHVEPVEVDLPKQIEPVRVEVVRITCERLSPNPLGNCLCFSFSYEVVDQKLLDEIATGHLVHTTWPQAWDGTGKIIPARDVFVGHSRRESRTISPSPRQ